MLRFIMVWVKCGFIPFLDFQCDGKDEPNAEESCRWIGMLFQEVSQAERSKTRVFLRLSFTAWTRMNGPTMSFYWKGEWRENRRCISDPTGGINVVWGSCCHWSHVQYRLDISSFLSVKSCLVKLPHTMILWIKYSGVWVFHWCVGYRYTVLLRGGLSGYNQV